MITNEEEHLTCLLAICASSFVKCLYVLVSFPSRSKLYSPALRPWRLTCMGCSRRLLCPQVSVLVSSPMGDSHREIRIKEKGRMGIPWRSLCEVTAGWLTFSTKRHNSCQAAPLVSVTAVFLCPARPLRKPTLLPRSWRYSSLPSKSIIIFTFYI